MNDAEPQAIVYESKSERRASLTPLSLSDPGRRPYPSSIARVVIVIATLLCSIEVAARVDDWIRLGVPVGHTTEEVVDLRVTDSLGLHGRPYGRYHAWRLNNFGFRGPDMTNRPTKGCIRILVLGASETMGLYESPGKEFPAQLRDSLKRLGCFEVVNAGIPGMALKSIVRFWNSYASRFGAQIVVIYPSPAFYLATELSGWPPPPSATAPIGPPPSVPWRPRLVDRLHQTLHTPDFLQRIRLERWIAHDTRDKPPSWFFNEPPPDRADAFIKDLDSLVTDVRAAGATPVVMTHATRSVIPPRPEDALLLLGWRHYTPRATTEAMLRFERLVAVRTREYGARSGTPVVDIDSALTGRSEMFGDVVHFTNQGSATVASVIVRGLVATGLAGREHPAPAPTAIRSDGEP